LKERYGLTPVILSEQASKGRSIIEKFESEARDISYAFALLTPDDFISQTGTTYSQARPNVVFEIGWFYGRLGRDRVTILFREGTSVPSDLDGILRIQFHKSIEENVRDIENELLAADLLSNPNANEA
jgi:predicted nucleotide-binding protein